MLMLLELTRYRPMLAVIARFLPVRQNAPALLRHPLTVDANRARVDGLAELVGGLAHVGAGVLWVGVQDVQRHVAEVVRCPEPVVV